MAKPAPAKEPLSEMMKVSMPISFAVRVHQRAAGVAGIDGRVGLNKVAGLARIVVYGLGRSSALMMPRVTENWK